MTCYENLKKETFINTFNQVNKHFMEIFTDLTDGEGKLVLENPENPFLGGLTVEVLVHNLPFRSSNTRKQGPKTGLKGCRSGERKTA